MHNDAFSASHGEFDAVMSILRTSLSVTSYSEDSKSASQSTINEIIYEHLDLVNGHNLCFNRLCEATREAEALRQEDASLCSLNRELNENLSLTIQAAVQNRISSDDFVNRFHGLCIGDEGAVGREVLSDLDESPKEEVAGIQRVYPPKSISVRSDGYLKLSQPGESRGGQTQTQYQTSPLSTMHLKQKVIVNGGKKEQDALKLDLYNLGMWKTELCNKWQETGASPYGDHCQFAHGMEELRPVIRHPRYKTEGAGKSAVLNSLTGHPILPTGENGATRAPISIDLQRDGSLSSKAIILQIDSALRHSLLERLSKGGSSKGRDEIYLELHTSTAPSLKLVDLPGLDQRIMDDSTISYYAEHNDAILMVIIPAAQAPEISSSRALQIAKEYDGEDSTGRVRVLIKNVQELAKEPSRLCVDEASSSYVTHGSSSKKNPNPPRTASAELRDKAKAKKDADAKKQSLKGKEKLDEEEEDNEEEEGGKRKYSATPGRPLKDQEGEYMEMVFSYAPWHWQHHPDRSDSSRRLSSLVTHGGWPCLFIKDTLKLTNIRTDKAIYANIKQKTSTFEPYSFNPDAPTREGTPTREDLTLFWPSTTNVTDDKFWENEWLGHGIFSIWECEVYFTRVYEVGRRMISEGYRNLSNVLSRYQNGQEVTVQTLYDDLIDQFFGCVPYIELRTYAGDSLPSLYQIRFLYTIDLEEMLSYTRNYDDERVFCFTTL